MKGRYIVTLDAGTGSGRCLIFDLEGNQIAQAQEEWIPKEIPEYPGSQEFDTKEAWEILCRTIRTAMARGGVKPEEVLAITASSMREGMVLYDKDGNEIWACTNLDARAVDEAIELINSGLAEKIFKIGGDWLNIIDPPRFLWLKKHQPEIFNRIGHMNMLSDWVLFKLSGKIITDPSIGSSSGMFDLAKRTWSDEIINMVGLSKDIFPPVYESGTIIGEVTQQASKDTGLLPGTPVVTGGADTQLALIGVSAVENNRYVVVGGTQWQTAVVTDKPLIDPKFRVRTLCHSMPGFWMTEGIGFYHGFSTRWFRDAFCQLEKEMARQMGVDPYYLLEKLAEQAPPGSNGIIAIFSDVMNARRWKHAAPSFLQFDILSPQTSGKKECYRALEENAAYVSYGNYQVLLELTNTPAEEIVFCGGSSKGFLWPQIMADVYGVRIKVPLVKEATSLGSAMVVGVAMGVYKDFGEAVEKLVRFERVYEPNMENHRIYQEYYKKWREIYPRMLQLVDEGLLKPMWRAPGT